MRLARDQVSIVIIGEIARMELTFPGFVQAIEAMFAGPLTVVATVHVHEHPVTDALKRRHKIELATVVVANPDGLPAQLFYQLTGAATQGGSG
jgi:nucleoside-triphosphatase THEP1